MVRMSIRSGSRPVKGLLFGLLAVLAAAGCEENGESFASLTPIAPPEPQLDLAAGAGVPVEPSTPPIPRIEIGGDREYRSRQDPFRLMAPEVLYDESQRTERFLGEVGGFRAPVNLAAISEVPIEVFIEPVPAWRLSGVIIGEGVLALLDTGAGVHEVRPGTRVPGTEWTVVSIDADRAVLRREGNVLPHEFAVNLQGPIGGTFPIATTGRGAGGQRGGQNDGDRGGAAAAGGGGSGID